MIEGLYVNTPLADLQVMRADALQNKRDILNAHQQYAMAGRQVSRAPLVNVMKEIAEIDYAIKLAGGTLARTSVPDMSGGMR